MFSFLKEKIKNAVSKISSKLETGEAKEKAEKVEEKIQEIKEPIEKVVEEKKEIVEEQKVEEKKEVTEEVEEPQVQEVIKEKEEAPVKEEKKVEEPVEEKKGVFSKLKEKITSTSISENEFEESFNELELVLLENNVAVEVIDRIKGDLSKTLVNQVVKRGKIEETILETLKNTIEDVLRTEKIDFLETVKSKKPYIICFVGINGSGKTTTIAKVAKYLQNNNLSCVLAASDTFRAAAIDQLEHHAKKLGVKIIKHDYGADPAAVAFDAIQHAKSKNLDVVLIDTAGRLHSNKNLLDEMKKIIRVANPDMKLFVGESITGNDCVEQAKTFNSTIGLDGVILSKADVDEKGGTAVSIGNVTNKPIIFIGVGQEYEDLKVFDSNIIMKGLGLT
ncbi:signal recognition particle-docking protein FtsY [Nanoarchaeota archaeon]